MGSNGILSGYLSLRFFKQLQHAKMQPRDVPPSFGIQDSLGLLPLEDFSPVTVSICFPKGPGDDLVATHTKSGWISLAPGSLLSDLLDLLVEVGTRSCHQSLHLTISGVRG